jgi:hypothetical protein
MATATSYAATVLDGGGDILYTNPNNASGAPDGVLAVVTSIGNPTLISGLQSAGHTGVTAAIGADSTLTGVAVHVVWSESGAGDSVTTIENGSVQFSTTATPGSDSLVETVFGGAGQLWGRTVAQWKAASLDLFLTTAHNNLETISVDSMYYVFHFTPESGMNRRRKFFRRRRGCRR